MTIESTYRIITEFSNLFFP